MNELVSKHCVPCEGGVEPLDGAASHHYLQKLSLGWQLDADGKSIRREYAFKNFYRTMSFVNAVAHIANTEDHHPDLEVGYNYCRIKFTTHAIGGLSENDFICAARIDALSL
ncbi:MAG: 4a-hydroxytetrahydrobiopterin dehydratase [Steroidobacteraceae bacterium]